ncbi:MAG: PEP-CTERM sorting domain-containing protein [Phycisphaerae bacterium]
MPEPATLGLLALGGVTLLSRAGGRKRKARERITEAALATP